MTHALSLCLWRRPTYTRQVLEALSKCDGIQKYQLFVWIDGPRNAGDEVEAVRKLAHSIDFAPKIILARDFHVGCNLNTFGALYEAFKDHDYVVHVEDDVVLSTDALRWFEFGRQFAFDKNIWCVGAWRHEHGWLPGNGEQAPGENFRYGLQKGFWIWGWATWKDRWEEMRAGWTRHYDASSNNSWDTVLTKTVRGNRMSLLPYISRAINIGEHAGTHTGATILPYWAGSSGFVQPKFSYE